MSPLIERLIKFRPLKPMASPFQRFKRLIVGAPRDPLAAGVRDKMALIAFLAWVGLGADGLSSANYGPEEAFIALGGHGHMALYLAIATALTVVLICVGYNQVIELFPSGGGGYKVASILIGPRAGLVSGAALIVNFILTAAISIAAGVDALFSLLPDATHFLKLPLEVIIAIGLIVANLRGVKETLVVLVPVFVGFLVTHVGLILYGVVAHAADMPAIVADTVAETGALAAAIGWVGVLAVLLRGFALGGGTYTGIEAVSNNVGLLKAPRLTTARWTMVYMAISLAVAAAGLMLLYVLWQVVPEPGQTLNAVTFRKILGGAFGDGSVVQRGLLAATLVFAACLLFVAANTGFLGGPAVLAVMAQDDWVPHQFKQLSDRLVTQNGVLLLGLAAIAILLVTGGSVRLLVVLYSINVFISFVLSFTGLCGHWWRRRREQRRAIRRLVIALLGLIVTGGILAVTIVTKLLEGAWMTVLITGALIALCVLIRGHYAHARRELSKIDALFATATPSPPVTSPPPLDPRQPTAVFFVSRSLGTGMHTLLAALQLFPGQFKNFLFLSVGEIDSQSFQGEELLAKLQQQVTRDLAHYVNYCQRRGMAAASFHAFGPETTELLSELADKVLAEHPRSVFFASKLLFKHDNLFIRLLHNQTAFVMQRRLHWRGIPMMILPMKL